MQWLRSLAAFAALAIALLLWAEDADARLEGAERRQERRGNFSDAASCCAGACRDCGERPRDYRIVILSGWFARWSVQPSRGARRFCRGLSRLGRARPVVRSRLDRRTWQCCVGPWPRLSTRADRTIVL